MQVQATFCVSGPRCSTAKSSQTRLITLAAVSRRAGSTIARLLGLPRGFKGIEPGALDGAGRDQEPDGPSWLRLLRVCTNPMPYFLAAMPGGLAPDQYQHALPRAGQTLTEPGEPGGRPGADRPPVHKPQPDLVGGGP
jgi:hypothetical protein